MRISRGLLLLAAVSIVGAQASSARAELIYGLTGDGQNIFSFDSLNPGKILAAQFITNYTFSNEQILTIDVNPNNGSLYAVSSRGVLYTLNATTGVLGSVGAITGATISGTNFDSDINPTNSSFRFVSDTNQNLGINVATAAATVNTNLNFTNGATSNIAGIAYSNNVAGASSTTLYGLDATSNDLVTINAPTGVLTTIGGTGIDFTDLAGFDISNSGIAYAALQPISQSISDLYTVNLTTGLVTDLGQIGGGLPVRDITMVAGGSVAGPGVPEPATLGLLALGVPALLLRRRRA